MSRVRILAGVAAVGAIGAGAVAAGLRTSPEPFPPFPRAETEPTPPTIPTPTDLPDPVVRWLVGQYGLELPLIKTLVVSGRARIRPFGVWLPARFRFAHDAGQGYRHYIEATFAGRPFLRVNESYRDGRALMEIPGMRAGSGSEVDQAANMGMWAELAQSAPSVLATDPRVRWSGIDDQTALFTFPLGEGTDELVVRFDPETGSLASLEGWRYRSAGDPRAILWVAAIESGPVIGPWGLPAVGTATWADQAEPWARFCTEEIVVNVDLRQYLTQKGA